MVDYPKFYPTDDDVSLADLAKQAAIDSSNGQIVDYGDSSPLAVLLEGQVYAGGTLLRRINQIYKRVTWEFLRLARLTPIESSNARVTLTVKLTGSRPIPWLLPVGSSIRCSKTAELWHTEADLTILPGSTTGQVVAIGPKGSSSNVRPGLVWSSIVGFAFIDSITNSGAAYGGTDQEPEQNFLDRCAYALASRRSIITAIDYETNVIDQLGNGGIRAIAIPRLSRDKRSSELGSVHVFACGIGNKTIPLQSLEQVESTLSLKVLLGTRLYVSPCESVLVDVQIIVNSANDLCDLIIETVKDVNSSIPLGSSEYRLEMISKAIWQSPKLANQLKDVYSVTFNGEGQPISLDNLWSVPLHRSIYVECVNGTTVFRRTWLNSDV